MGARSYIMHQEIEVVDRDGLKEFREKIRNGEIDYYLDDSGKPMKFLADSIVLKGEQRPGWDEPNIVEEDCVEWDDWKICSYWYDHFVFFIRDLAVFIDGEVEIECSEAEAQAKLYFSGGACNMEIGSMEWESRTPKTLQEESMEQEKAWEKAHGIKPSRKCLPELPEWLKRKALLRGGS